MSRPDATEGSPAREIAEEAIAALRAAPIGVWGAYYLGTVPFCVVLIYFLNTMAISPAAHRELSVLAAALAVLFAWMKAWQARFAATLMAQVAGDAPPPFGVAALWGAVCRQTPRHATGLVLLPLAVATVFFYVPVYSYYQNLTALDGRAAEGAVKLGAAARAEAGRWKKQAFVLLWMFSPALVLFATGMAWLSPSIVLLYGTAPGIYWQVWTQLLAFFTYFLSPVCAVLWLNLAGAAVFAGVMLKSYLDIDTIFAWAPEAAMNQGLLSGIAAACYLVMDPVVKAAFVVRCHRGISLSTGQDLRMILRRLASAGAVVLAVLAAAPSMAEGPPAADEELSASLDRALDEELSGAEYVWRAQELDEDDRGWLQSQVDRLSQWCDERIEAFNKWLRRGLEEGSPAEADELGLGAGLFGAGLLGYLGYAAIAVLLVSFLYIALQVATQQWKLFQQETAQLESAVVSGPVEITDEGARADALPEGGWLEMANGLYARGEFRLAMRALFLATLSVLAERQFIKIVRHKSNAEYLREVRLRCAAEMAQHFSHGTGLYEEVWYGEHPATAEGFAALRTAHDKVAGR